MSGFSRPSPTGRCCRGQRIRQNELADKLGVSRQPVSHALHLLHRQGLVAESGRRGFEVTQLDPARIRQLYEVRGAIDALAAKLAAKRRPAMRRDARGWKRRCTPGAASTARPSLARADRTRRRFSSRDLPARRQSRDRGDDRAAMAAYAPLDGDRAVRARLSRQRLDRACRRSPDTFSPATRRRPNARRWRMRRRRDD